MVKLQASITPEWQAAAARAWAQADAGNRVERIGPRTYRAHSAHGDETYTVEVLSVLRLEYRCDCPHGKSGRAGRCWHGAQAVNEELKRVAAAERARQAAGHAPSPGTVEYERRRQERRDAVNAKMARFSRQ